MPAPAETILILGGTAEANALVSRLCASEPALRILLSLAGCTARPILPAGCEIRIGGFGGAEGLAAFLREAGASWLVDATHPFAAGISRNAARAATLAGVRRIAFVRPAWDTRPGDNWIDVDCLGSARDALPMGARPFLALGRQHLAPFAHRPDLTPVVRMIDPPEPPLAFAAEIVLGRPSSDAETEAALLRRLGVTHLVCRNSGGARSYAKVAAARRLGLPVVMIARPPAPSPPLAGSLDAVLALLDIAA
ncbi:cobalt-precorrin-6A reductase [Aurantimonas sp. DM33-3]|uniref:cobalt-precorrin-6A reductase n=1 Tax=Aurantimonas sp. DM33-3 TaxID=2766955 RepID=UPI0016528D2E|nr:cobalt-precorrin-6A reductase [Aurantimonas sp. DM33-3]MBC6715360.1 cobalt-precorrin-6A reductase [Aurantimonas sp. DM33-3]